jgi:dTDP-4-amino-4,6-dideoxygalactose transaminase
VYRIPLNKPFLAGDELQYVAESITRGQISGDGSFTRRCHRLLEER